jgi:hypothetical protein
MTEEKCEFKSADELGLTHKEWAALITILPLLEHDVIRHAPEGSRQTTYVKRDKPEPVFNMSTWNESLACGTAMCIGGSAEFFGKLRPGQMEDRANDLSFDGNYALINLFYPHEINGWGSLTPQQAAVALRHYLTTGEDGGWQKALKKTKKK